HDRRRVRVDEDDPVSLALQGAASLGAGVVELTGLADDDRPGPDDEDGVEIGSPGHPAESSGILGGLDEAVRQKRAGKAAILRSGGFSRPRPRSWSLLE